MMQQQRMTWDAMRGTWSLRTFSVASAFVRRQACQALVPTGAVSAPVCLPKPPPMRVLAAAAGLAATLTTVSGHGAVVNPP